MERIGRSTSIAIGIGSMFGLVNDLIEPFRALSFWIIFFAAVVIVIALLAAISPLLARVFAAIPAPLYLKSNVKKLGVQGVIFISVTFALMAVACNFFTVKNQDEGGVLAASFPNIREWQVTLLGIHESVQAIESDVDVIRDQTVSISDGVEELNDKTDEVEKGVSLISDNTKVIGSEVQGLNDKAENFKKEVSSDPRKELANMQIGWDVKSYRNAILRGDIRTIELFIYGGMNLDNTLEALEITQSRGNAVSRLFQLSSTETIIDVLTLLREVGVDMNSYWLAPHQILTEEGKVKELYEYTSFIREAAIHSNKVVISYLIGVGASITNHPYSRYDLDTGGPTREDDCSLIASLLTAPQAIKNNDYNHIDYLVEQGAVVDDCARAIASTQVVPLFMLGGPLIKVADVASKIETSVFDEPPTTLLYYEMYVKKAFEKEQRVRDIALKRDLKASKLPKDVVLQLYNSSWCTEPRSSDMPSCRVRLCSVVVGQLLCEKHQNLVQKSHYIIKSQMGWE